MTAILGLVSLSILSVITYHLAAPGLPFVVIMGFICGSIVGTLAAIKLVLLLSPYVKRAVIAGTRFTISFIAQIFSSLSRVLVFGAQVLGTVIRSASQTTFKTVVSVFGLPVRLTRQVRLQKFVVSFLMKKNSRLSCEVETLKAQLNEVDGELQALVSTWSPVMGEPPLQKKKTARKSIAISATFRESEFSVQGLPDMTMDESAAPAMVTTNSITAEIK